MIQGKVLSVSTGQALEGATVRIQNKNGFVLSDQNVFFEITAADTTGTSIVSYIGLNSNFNEPISQTMGTCR